MDAVVDKIILYTVETGALTRSAEPFHVILLMLTLLALASFRSLLSFA